MSLINRSLGTLCVLLAISGTNQAWSRESQRYELMAEAEVVRERVLDVRASGTSIGGIWSSIARTSDGGLLYEWRMRSIVPGAYDNWALQRYDSEGALEWTWARLTKRGVTSDWNAEYGEGHVDVTSDRHGEREVVRLQLPKSHDTRFRAFRRLLPEFLSGREASATYELLVEGRFVVRSLRIVKEVRLDRDGEAWPGFEVEFGTKRMVFDSEGLQMSYEEEGDIRGHLVESHELASNLTVNQQFPVSGPMPPAELRLRRLELRVDLPLVWHDAIEACRYQSVRSSGQSILIGLRAMEASGLPVLEFPLRLPDQTLSLFLRATTRYESGDPRIRSRARQAVGGALDAVEAARRIAEWVHSWVRQEGGSPARSALEVLESQRGDCKACAALMVALCRAAGIPSRSVVGYVYRSNGISAALEGHAWVEVWLGKWFGVDPTLGEFGTQARYLGLATEGEISRGLLVLALRKAPAVSVTSFDPASTGLGVPDAAGDR